MSASASISIFQRGSSSSATTTMVAGWTDVPEELAVHERDGIGVFGRRQEHARTDDVLEAGTRLGQCGDDDAEAPARLQPHLFGTRAVEPDRPRSRDPDAIVDAQGATEADGGLERGTRSDLLALALLPATHLLATHWFGRCNISMRRAKLTAWSPRRS